MKQKKITITDIAKSAKVSKSTVSRVLNNTTPVEEKKHAAVVKAMKRLKFKPNVFARTLAGGKSMTLGVVTQNIGSPTYDGITIGVIQGLSKTDYAPIFVDGQWEQKLETAALETLIDRRVDGIVMVGGDLDAKALEPYQQQVPVILVARQLDGWEARTVSIDNVSAGRAATKFLIDSGHRNIAHVKGIRNHQDAIDRFLGYQQALAEAGIELSEDLVVEGDFSSRAGLLAAESLLLRGVPFSAIFSANDQMAFGIRLALYRRGIRVPEDVSIVGFDDQPASAFMTPPLTTMRQPAIEMGIAAANMLVGTLTKNSFVLPDLRVDLVVRESVARR